MNPIFLTGLIGSIILVIGAAWPEPTLPKHPTQSTKNWLFAVGGVVMLAYSILGYMQGSPIFFVLLEILIVISNILMMLKVDDRIDVLIIGLGGLGFSIWSLYLFQGYATILFVIGLSLIGFGYSFDMKTLRRAVALTLGSLIIAAFSYLEASWIFFWLNTFFAIFSGYHMIKIIGKSISDGQRKSSVPQDKDL